ncbi:diguanylate cyclase [Oryzomicrobium terrae]|uniref:diguanylate cyclase n=1 Tax=Oryzomicrobium terrae TaxID=1735038 RepID=A0A5C1E869_9RHOO|nr:diguanylate cyclase [Oryzomicrobium terrae]QEL64418.1 diguanylate cyclase [Oryzomicrobium terrae]
MANADTNPLEIAREALLRLATRRIPPTPANYRALYHEIAGTQDDGSDALPDAVLRSLVAALPRATPAQLRLARLLEDGVQKSGWNGLRDGLAQHARTLEDRAGWGNLISELLRLWELRQPGLTPARKREGLQRVLASQDDDTLYPRLQGLIKGWGDASAGLDSPDAMGDLAPANEAEAMPDAATTSRTGLTGSQFMGGFGSISQFFGGSAPDEDLEAFADLRELLATSLETALAPVVRDTAVAEQLDELAVAMRAAKSVKVLRTLTTKVKHLAFKMEILTGEQAEIRTELLRLFGLLVENVGELVLDDQWLHGQMEIVRDLVARPLDIRALEDAERRLKEVIFKQSQLKQSLQEAKEALKQMLAGFVDHLADFSESTSEYHDKLEAFAGKISSANSLAELGSVLDEVMRQTRVAQLNTQRTRDELHAARSRVEQAEAHIAQLQAELDRTSAMVRHDQLTGTLNRRGLDEALEKEMARSRRYRAPLCIGLLDVDNFKKLNDSLGHQAGDAALIHLTQVIRDGLRPQDSVARYGGEEFLLLLPNTTRHEAVQTVQRLQRELTRRFFLHNNQKLLITFSAGVTELNDRDNEETALARADAAMYEAKQTGKNRVIEG